MFKSLYPTIWGEYHWLNLQNTVITNTIMQSVFKGVGWKQTPSETRSFTPNASQYNREKEEIHTHKLFPPSLLRFITFNWRCIFFWYKISLRSHYYGIITFNALCSHLYLARNTPLFSSGQLKWERIDSLCHKAAGCLYIRHTAHLYGWYNFKSSDWLTTHILKTF